VRLIHCADIHLDATMESRLPLEKARLRRQEVLHSFLQLFDIAKEQKADVILVAGDLFDSDYIAPQTVEAVISAAESHPQIDLLYLGGNHDRFSKELFRQRPLPKNLKNFSRRWQSYSYGDVVITGVEMEEGNASVFYDSLFLDDNKVNIVTLHGQTGSSKGLELIDLKALSGRGIDYLALGHVHQGQEVPFDQRGKAVYSGSLEGRGFDEPGVKGFVVVDIEGKTVSYEFVPFAKRQVRILSADITSCHSLTDLKKVIEETVKDIPKEDMVRVELVGFADETLSRDDSYFEEELQRHFFWGEIKDSSRLKIDYSEYQNDISLKGEFVRLLQMEDFSPEEKNQILQYGLKALRGEDPVL